MCCLLYPLYKVGCNLLFLVTAFSKIFAIVGRYATGINRRPDIVTTPESGPPIRFSQKYWDSSLGLVPSRFAASVMPTYCSDIHTIVGSSSVKYQACAVGFAVRCQ